MRSVGRYELWSRIAVGGMGAVHLGCVRGEAGFRRAVAIKSMHAAIASDPASVGAFIDEARLAARLRHPNLVSTIDVAAENDELILVMDYVHGETLARLVHGVGQLPIGFGVAVILGALRGLHAAHETLGDDGKPLGLVHRDVSPQNIIVGVDGVPRVTDFGVAKAAGRIQLTGSGGVKGKLAYMAPEQLAAEDIDRRTDVFALGICFWELLTGVHLFYSANDAATVKRIVAAPIDPPSKHRPDVPPEIEAIVMRALSREMNDRYASAREMADALEATGLASSVSEIGEWVAELAAEALAERGAIVAAIERSRASTGDLQRFAERVADASSRAPSDDLRPRDPGATTNGASTIETARGALRTTPVRLMIFAVAFIVIVLGGAVLIKRSRAQREEMARQPVREQTAPPPAAATIPPPEPDDSLALDLPPTPATAGHPKKKGPRTPASAKPSANCADPYTRDSLGRKIYKRECLND